jgi:hypothetical protein
MQVYIGIDWSENKHDIVIMNEAGAAIARQTIAHTPQGFLELEASCQNLGLPPDACLYGMDRVFGQDAAFEIEQTSAPCI